MMVCIEKIYSVSALIGSGACNANCDFCAGKYLRPDAVQSLQNERNLESAIKLSARYGGWSLSLTGSGEPTVEPEVVTRALEIYDKCAQEGAYFPNVNLFTNGIRFGDREFVDEYVPRWRELGLTNIALSIHDVDRQKQAKAYNVKDYPAYEDIRDNVRKHGVGVRGTLLLRRGGVENGKTYANSVNKLIDIGFNNITSWSVGNPDGSRNEFTPSSLGLIGIKWWLFRNAKLCHGHSWGGGVYDYKGNILRITDYVTKHNPKKDFVRQLVVFQDESVDYSWIREGAKCMK